MSTDTLIFSIEGSDHEIALLALPGSETLRQLRDWLPADITIHCAKIAGCHIYWPTPILARLEKGTDIHTLGPGAVLYYPDRQYLEIIYDELQAETASVTHLGQLQGDIGWLREFASRQRQEAGSKPFTATIRLKGAEPASVSSPSGQDTAWARIQRGRHAAWQSEPGEIRTMLANCGHNIPFGPMVNADSYFRFVQESLWQLWNEPDRFSDAQKRAAAINAMELGIFRLGHYCHLNNTEALLADAISCVESKDVPLQDLLREVILYCSRMSNWVDTHIPWYSANELTKKALGRTD
jgi:hypothetical protein